MTEFNEDAPGASDQEAAAAGEEAESVAESPARIPHPISDVADWGDKPTGPMKIMLPSEIEDPEERRDAEAAMAEAAERMSRFPKGDD